MAGDRCRTFLTLCGMAVFLSSLGDCNEGVCHCWDEMDDVLKAEIQPSNTPLEQFSYAGVKRVNNNTFTPCVCSDVLRRRSALAVDNSTLAGDIRHAAEGNAPSLQPVAMRLRETFIELLNAKDPTEKTLDVYVTFLNLSQTNVNESIWELEVVTKGRRGITEEMLVSEIREKTKSADGEYIIADVGSFEGSDLSFETLTCTGSPASAPSHGTRVWKTTQQYPGDVATYECDPGYFLVEADKASSKCSHENVTWPPSDDIPTCERGCSEDPPSSPFFTIIDWEPTMRKEGEKIVYYCMSRYRSISGENGSSRCENSQWTPLQDDFGCERILCPKSIPQVPANADSDYDLVYRPRFVDTRIKYFCIDGYISTMKGDVYSVCDPSGNWTQLPSSFQCITLEAAKEAGILYEQKNNIYSKNDPQSDKISKRNWFWLITAPSALGLILTFVCCLCCTRSDSPIFIPFSSSTEKPFYY